MSPMRLIPAVIALAFAAGPLSAQAAEDVVAGEKIFRRCASCHSVGPAPATRMGPALNGVMGRKAGTYPDYSYSAGLTKSGLVWKKDTLAAYLKNPRAAVPGTKMAFAGLQTDDEITDVIAYLKQFDAEGAKRPAR